MLDSQALDYWDDEYDDDIDLEDDDWWRPGPRVILLAILLAPLARPAVCVLAWAILWVAYATGTSPEPPPTWTLWAS